MAGEFIYFSIYVLQQLGVMLGVGAQTVLLCAHLLALHRGEPDSANTPVRAARTLLGAGLALMIVSGAGAVLLHLSVGTSEVLWAPAFIFKWLLIAGLAFAWRWESGPSHATVAWGLFGGSWYALFLVHSIAPATTWGILLALYASWMVVFLVVWSGFTALMHGKRPAAL